MTVVVLGLGARRLGATVARHPGAAVAVAADPDENAARDLADRVGATRWTVDPLQALDGGDALHVLLSSRIDRAVDLAGMALTAGHRVMLAGTPVDDRGAWDALARTHEDGLILSRSLGFDSYIVTARSVVEAADVGAPRTIHLGWSFPAETNLMDASAELADVACWLLETHFVLAYALECDVAGSSLLHINLHAANGALALLEVTVDTEGFPMRRDLHLLARDGEIVHRTGGNDLLWSEDRAEILQPSIAADGPLRREIAAWLGSERSEQERLVRGESLCRSLAVAHALATSIARNAPVAVMGEDA